jgi:hypothetical protein
MHQSRANCTAIDSRNPREAAAGSDQDSTLTALLAWQSLFQHMTHAVARRTHHLSCKRGSSMLLRRSPIVCKVTLS